MSTSVTQDKSARTNKKKMPAPRAKLLAQQGLGEPHDKPVYITPDELSVRWRCSIESVKYYRRIGLLHPHFITARRFKYSLAEVEQIEREAGLAAAARA
jgi:hypothetical protein